MISNLASINVIKLASSIAEPSQWPSRDDIINALVPNLYTLTAHIIATAIVLFFVIKWVWKPMKEMLQRRQNFIQGNIDDSTRTIAVANEHLMQAKIQRDKARSDAELILSAATTEATKVKEDLIKEGRTYSDSLKHEAEIQLAKNETQLRSKIQDEIITASLQIAQKVLKKEIDAQEHKKIFDEFLTSIDKI